MPGYLLLVDDNPNNLRLLIAILREKGYEIRPASSGPRALAMIGLETPELILLDINMPGMDGYEVCRRLKADEATADIPVLFISANDETESKLQGFEAGAVDYITKPFQEAEVLARIDAQLTIRRQKRQLEGILDSSHDGIVACEAVRDAQGSICDFRFVMLNPAAARMLGDSRQALAGQFLLNRLPFLRESGLFAELAAVAESGRSLDREIFVADAQSWIHLIAVRLEDGLAVTFRDTSERKRLELALARMAELDGLTGIANRRVYDASLERETRRCAREQLPLALLMCDIDAFKLYNDRLGHLEGDRCLLRVAEAIQSAVRRPGDLAARYGGEEFAVILPNTDAEGALEVARGIAAAVAALELPHPASERGQVTLSIGLACRVPEPGAQADALLAEADQALYRAKQAGRDRILTFESV